MVDRDAHYGVLTNFKRAIFFYRPKKPTVASTDNTASETKPSANKSRPEELDNTVIMSREYIISNKDCPDDFVSFTQSWQPTKEFIDRSKKGPTILRFASWFAQACESFYKGDPGRFKVDLEERLKGIDFEYAKNIFKPEGGASDHWGIRIEYV